VERNERDFRPADLRRCLGSFVTGVVVVTTAYEGREHGMTANSFASVSLSPPLVLICTDNKARMTHVLEPGMEFGLSVLASHQSNISRHFAGRHDADLAVSFVWRRGVPMIAEAAAHFICRLTDSRVAGDGDHTVHLAEVEYHERWARAPLAFFSGAYTQIAQDGEGLP
jgi:flavin reductase (DIM6/NTAB) family NADH-FMN oxidoreductase RutF